MKNVFLLIFYLSNIAIESHMAYLGHFFFCFYTYNITILLKVVKHDFYVCKKNITYFFRWSDATLFDPGPQSAVEKPTNLETGTCISVP